MNNVDYQETLRYLPSKKLYEYAFHKLHNKDVSFKTWRSNKDWKLSETDVTRFYHTIVKQLEHIKDKKILDIACNLGYLTLFCLHNGAKYVTGIDVRDYELSIAKEICSFPKYNNFSFANHSVYDENKIKELCDNVDTVLFSGIIYHVNNHMNILKKIYESTAKTLIIESKTHTHEPEIPSLRYFFEDSSDSLNGVDNNRQLTFVGMPNQKWLSCALEYIGYNITYNEKIHVANHMGIEYTRVIIVGQKKLKS